MSDKHSVEMEWAGLLSRPSAAGKSARDPLNVGQSARSGTAELLFGRVLGSVGGLYCYRVALENGRGIRPCVLGASTGLLPFGAKEITTIPPNSMVWCIVHPQITYGVIVCVEPEAATDPTRSLAGWVTRASRCGVQVDRSINAVLDTQEGAIVDWGSNRPVDVVGNEYGVMTETGLRLTVDSFMGQLAIDESSGFFLFYHDQLVRWGGVNSQEWSAGHVREMLDDESEILYYHGVTPYPWEQMGALRPETATTTEKTDREVQLDPGHFASVEPVDQKQQPFHRHVELKGYIGQGQKHLVQAPPQQGDLFKYEERSAPLGLLEVQEGLYGHYSVRAAGGIFLSKRLPIPAPKRLRLPHDPSGDTASNYKAAGQNGEGPDHKVTNRVANEGDYPHLQQAAGLFDVHAHLFNWLNLNGVYYHRKDFFIPEESDNGEFNKVTESIDFSELLGKSYISRPSPVQVRLDHRKQQAEFFPNESSINLFDDGGQVYADGYGAEIRMVGGNIRLSCPGDISLEAGRNVNLLAGHDIIQRAKYSVDVSSTENDVRLRGWRNVHVASGQSGSGSFLVENNASGSMNYQGVGEDVSAGGIHFKAKSGQIVFLGGDIYLRTGGGDVQSGSIVLDAARGDGQIVTHSGTFSRYIGISAEDRFGSGSVEKVNFYSSAATVIGSLMYVDGGAFFDGPVANRGGMSTIEGAFGAEVDPPVGILKNQGLQQVRDILQQVDQVEQQQVTSGNAARQQDLDQKWYGDNQAGNDGAISATKFTCRTVEQYMTSDFVMFESRWQQMARLGNGIGTVWTEKPSGGEYPYPGTLNLTSKPVFYTQDITLFDLQNGRSKDRESNQTQYEEPKFPAPTAQPLNSNYRVLT